MGIIIYNGQSSKEYGIQVEHPPGYQYPERDYEAVHIPGRNGDLIINYGSYQNVERTYELSVGSLNKRFPNLATSISVWLHSARGYARLEDSYEPEYYRMAIYVSEGDIENILNHGAKVEVSFNCKPQRFLKIGDKVKTLTRGGTVKNPTIFDSRPIITIYGSGQGTLRIGEYAVQIKNINNSIVIDSEMQDAYTGTTNRNLDVVLTKGFPLFRPGNNPISFEGGITRVEVIPKWWTL